MAFLQPVAKLTNALSVPAAEANETIASKTGPKVIYFGSVGFGSLPTPLTALPVKRKVYSPRKIVNICYLPEIGAKKSRRKY